VSEFVVASFGLAETIMSLPIIDLKKLDAAEIVRELRRACERDGFFLIRNHSVPREVVLDMKEASKAFFELPVEEKMKVYANKDNRGYTPFNQETLQQGTLGDSKEGYAWYRISYRSRIGSILHSLESFQLSFVARVLDF